MRNHIFKFNLLFCIRSAINDIKILNKVTDINFNRINVEKTLFVTFASTIKEVHSIKSVKSNKNFMYEIKLIIEYHHPIIISVSRECYLLNCKYKNLGIEIINLDNDEYLIRRKLKKGKRYDTN